MRKRSYYQMRITISWAVYIVSIIFLGDKLVIYLEKNKKMEKTNVQTIK